jgi:hypothetical protein
MDHAAVYFLSVSPAHLLFSLLAPSASPRLPLQWDEPQTMETCGAYG